MDRNRVGVAANAKEYVVRGDSMPLASGMMRESEDGKVDYLLVRDGPMFRRWAELMTRAVPKRGRRNWMKAHTEDDLERFKRSFARHAEQWLESLDGADDGEDHAAALIFNVNGAEYVKGLLASDTHADERTAAHT